MVWKISCKTVARTDTQINSWKVWKIARSKVVMTVANVAPVQRASPKAFERLPWFRHSEHLQIDLWQSVYWQNGLKSATCTISPSCSTAIRSPNFKASSINTWVTKWWSWIALYNYKSKSANFTYGDGIKAEKGSSINRIFGFPQW